MLFAHYSLTADITNTFPTVYHNQHPL